MRRQINVLEYLDATAERLPDKLAFADDTEQLTFAEVERRARALGSALAAKGFAHEPVVVFMGKAPRTIAAFCGVVTAGCSYVPIDREMPRYRMERILSSLQPRVMICDSETLPLAGEMEFGGEVCSYEELIAAEILPEKLADIRAHAIDTDPIYIVFTSGSTGMPKGVAACHRSVIDYIENLSEVLGFSEDTVFGNQTPLYFDACLKELYPTLKFGATTYLIPQELFMFPVKLVEYLNEHKINTVCWVVSALTMISSFQTFKTVVPEYLRTVAFGSEVFPMKQFALWRETLPEARFINLYGPTEATGMSCWYEVPRDREFEMTDAIPIGRPFSNTDILLLDADNKPAAEGEICIRGTCLTLGYYNDPEKTAESFVQNPGNTAYPELIYRTGDMARYDENGDLVFISRKDYQIKHMGHRIELGEIEAIVQLQDGIRSAACVFDDERKRIILCYTGDVELKAVAAELKTQLPRYMQPNAIKQLDRMPLTANGKIDRALLKSTYATAKRAR